MSVPTAHVHVKHAPSWTRVAGTPHPRAQSTVPASPLKTQCRALDGGSATGMEHLWSRAGANGGDPWRIGRPTKPFKQAQIVA
jgi:hypothetical protein